MQNLIEKFRNADIEEQAFILAICSIVLLTIVAMLWLYSAPKCQYLDTPLFMRC